MDLASINSTLQDAENIPVLRGIVHDLRKAVQIMTEIPVDPDVFDRQATNLDHLVKEGISLSNDLNAIVTKLSAENTWQGTAADEYLGPEGVRGPQNGGGGAGGYMNRNLHQALGALAANRISHQKSADFCRQVNALQIALWGEVVVAVIGVAAIVAATASLVAAPTDLISVPAVAADTAVASGTAGTIATMTATGGELTGELAVVVAQAEASLSAAYAAMAVIKISAAVLCVDIGLAVFEIARDDSYGLDYPTPLDMGKKKPNKLPLPPARVYPPNIKTDTERATYDYLMANYGLEVANEYALSLIVPYEVDQAKLREYFAILNKWKGVPFIDVAVMMKAGLTPAQIDSLIERYRWQTHTQLDVLTQRPDAAYILQQLAEYVQAPYFTTFGIDQIVDDLVNGSPSSYDGALYQLKVMQYVGGSATISHVEPTVPSTKVPRVVRGPDIVLKDGTVIQCKSYDWCRYYSARTLQWAIESLKKNIEADEARYPGSVNYYFDSSSECPMPLAVEQLLSNAGMKYKIWP